MSTNPESVARRLIEAFSRIDFEGMRSQLADDLRAYITNSDGGVDEVRGADEYLGRVEAMDRNANGDHRRHGRASISSEGIASVRHSTPK